MRKQLAVALNLHFCAIVSNFRQFDVSYLTLYKLCTLISKNVHILYKIYVESKIIGITIKHQSLPTSASRVKSRAEATETRLGMLGKLTPFRQDAILLRDMPVCLTRRYSVIFFSQRIFSKCSLKDERGECGVYCTSSSLSPKR